MQTNKQRATLAGQPASQASAAMMSGPLACGSMAAAPYAVQSSLWHGGLAVRDAGGDARDNVQPGASPATPCLSPPLGNDGDMQLGELERKRKLEDILLRAYGCFCELPGPVPDWLQDEKDACEERLRYYGAEIRYLLEKKKRSLRSNGSESSTTSVDDSLLPPSSPMAAILPKMSECAVAASVLDCSSSSTLTDVTRVSYGRNFSFETTTDHGEVVSNTAPLPPQRETRDTRFPRLTSGSPEKSTQPAEMQESDNEVDKLRSQLGHLRNSIEIENNENYLQLQETLDHCQELERTLAETRKKLSNAQAEQHNSQALVARLEQEIDSMKQASQGQEEQIRVLVMQMEQLTEQSRQYEALEEVHKTLLTDHETLKCLPARLQKTAQDAERQQQSFNELKPEMAALESKYESRMSEELLASKTLYEKQLDTARKELEDLTSRYENDLTASNRQISSLKAAQECQMQTEDFPAIQARYEEELTSTRAEFEKLITHHEKELFAAREQNASLIATQESLSANSKEEISVLQARYEQQLASTRIEIENLKNRFGKDLSAASEEIASLKVTEEGLNAELRRKLEATEACVSQASYDAVKKELSNMIESYERLNSEMIKYESIMMEKEKLMDELRSQCWNLEDDLIAEKVKWLGRKAGVVNFDGIAAHEGVSIATLRLEFRKMISDLRGSHLRALKTEQSKVKQLEYKISQLEGNTEKQSCINE